MLKLKVGVGSYNELKLKVYVGTPSHLAVTAPFDAKTRFLKRIAGRANTRRVHGAQGITKILRKFDGN